jgi:glycine cleavage system aminomethyltransferase T
VPGEEHYALGVRDVTHAYVVHEGEDDEGTWLQLGEGVHGHRVSSGHTFMATSRRAGKAGNVPEGFLDMTAAYAALEIDGPGAATTMRRLTAVGLDDLPTAGPVAHIRAFVFRTGEESFLLFFPQEYGHYLWEVAVDAVEPLGGGPRS